MVDKILPGDGVVRAFPAGNQRKFKIADPDPDNKYTDYWGRLKSQPQEHRARNGNGESVDYNSQRDCL
jgi:hypothetical protein